MSRTVSRSLRWWTIIAVVLAVACRNGAGPDEEVLTLEVAPERVPCVGEGAQQCLQVRSGPDEDWSLFYEAIDGFTHESGYHYVIRVARRVIADPPADGSSHAYRLLAILSKVAA